MSEVNTKARYWWFVLYPDSAPKNWIELIQKTGLPFCVSPLHDKDINPDGILKKFHYHILLAYTGPTTFKNVTEKITKPLNCPHPQFLQSPKGAWRYLTHKDNPEKFQYNDKDIKYFNGFCISDYIQLSYSDEDEIYNQIEDFIFENDISEFCQLVFALKTSNSLSMLSFLRRHSIYFKELINSYRYSKC